MLCIVLKIQGANPAPLKVPQSGAGSASEQQPQYGGDGAFGDEVLVLSYLLSDGSPIRDVAGLHFDSKFRIFEEEIQPSLAEGSLKPPLP